jgi:ribonuclease J
MYQMIRPRVAIPVHGEARHLMANAQIADECQVPYTLVIENGDVVKLGGSSAAIVDEVPVGRLASDGKALLPLEGSALKDRRRVMYNGSAVATVVLDRQGGLAAPPAVTMRKQCRICASLSSARSTSCRPGHGAMMTLLAKQPGVLCGA